MARHRGRNEGSLHQRENGTWRAQATVEGKRISYTADTRQECQKWLKQTINQIDSGLTFSGAQTTLSEFLVSWLITIKSALRPITFYQYEMTVRKHITPSLGMVKLKDLRPEQIQNLYLKKIEDGVGLRTVEIIHTTLHKSLAHALKLGLIIRNPSESTTIPKPEQKEMKFYDERQVSQFLFAVLGDRNEMLYHLAIATGLRQSELLGLKWSDLDWQKRTLNVQRQLKREPKDGDYFISPKTKAGRRTILLGIKTIEKLREHWLRQQHEIKAVGDRWTDRDVIFPSSIGTPLNQRNLFRMFKELIKQAGLPDIRFHDLRHTAATLMLNHGVPAIVVSRRLGHSKVSITLDIYGHLIQEMQDKAAELIDDLITPVEIELHPIAPEELIRVPKD